MREPSPRPEDEDETLLQAVGSTFRQSGPFYLLVPAILTLFFWGSGEGDKLWLTFTVNLIATVCIGGATQLTYLFGERWRIQFRFGLHYLLFLVVGTGVGTELTLAALRLIGDYQVWPFRLALWTIGGVVGAITASISILYDRLRKKARAEELRAEQAQRAAVAAQLDALRARVQPHFLFNALNTVAALVEEDPAAAVVAIERLSDLMRYSLEGEAEQLVPLAEELRCVEDYLALEALRFPTRLRARMEIDEAVRPDSVLVPRFVLQPSVENAIKHAVAHSPSPVEVRCCAQRLDDRLRLTVFDDGPGTSSTGGTQTSRAALRTRLELLYGERATLEAGPMPTGGYRVAVEFPATEGVEHDAA